MKVGDLIRNIRNPHDRMYLIVKMCTLACDRDKGMFLYVPVDKLNAIPAVGMKRHYEKIC